MLHMKKVDAKKNHEFFRYIIKKGVSLDTISQPEINEIFSNINSVKRKILKGENAFQYFSKLYGLRTLELFGINEIDSANIILK